MLLWLLLLLLLFFFFFFFNWGILFYFISDQSRSVNWITSVDAKFLFILEKKNIFSILYTHFYKTSISIYLFYYLFYLNNHFSHFSIIIIIIIITIIYLKSLLKPIRKLSLSLSPSLKTPPPPWMTLASPFSPLGWNRLSLSPSQSQALIYRDSFQLTQKLRSPPWAPKLILVDFQAPTHKHKEATMLLSIFVGESQCGCVWFLVDFVECSCVNLFIFG